MNKQVEIKVRNNLAIDSLHLQPKSSIVGTFPSSISSGTGLMTSISKIFLTEQFDSTLFLNCV
jgi:hypothetical protein